MEIKITQQKNLSETDVWEVVKEWYTRGMYAPILQDHNGFDLEEICDDAIEMLNDNREKTVKDKTIKDQAKVIKELWSELQTLKRILIDEHPLQWRDIQTKLPSYVQQE